MQWLFYVFLTVCTWGLYGVFLHSGQLAMSDPVFGRYKAFLFVGIAYFIFAVLAPLVLLKMQGSNFSFPSKGIWISLFAGTLGAIGAFGILLAFGAKGTPTVVMAIVFAGAPIVNAVVAMLMHPPKGGIADIPWQFYIGIAMAAAGGCLVSYYKPASAPAAKSASATAVPRVAPGAPSRH
jgi:drug/metabolite transporter (DMT)-like permease